MGISVLTIQDEPDGNVSINFTTDPVIESDTQPLTNSQMLGIMMYHDLRETLTAELETEEPEAQPGVSDSNL